MTNAANRVKIWRATDLHDAELLKGAYTRHSYPWHSHEELCFGMVIGGAIRLRTRTQEGIASAGSFVLINSDEVHQGLPPTLEGWQCRTIHILPEFVNAIASDVAGLDSIRAPIFEGPTLEDPVLTRLFLDLHRQTEQSASSLERQSYLVAIVARLVANHSRTLAGEFKSSREPAAVARARSYLDENLSDKVTLDELSLVADLPRFRLLRAFQHALGMTPHNYQLQARVRKAHSLLRRGDLIADVSAAVGFADQAHLTRAYKSIMGGTPGQFRTAALDAYGAVASVNDVTECQFSRTDR
jgi:AraC-like DNA-binding protein